VLELYPSTPAWRGDGKRGACQVVLEASRLDGQEKKEGATLSVLFAPAEELQAYTVCFRPPWTCDCIAFFKCLKD